MRVRRSSSRSVSSPARSCAGCMRRSCARTRGWTGRGPGELPAELETSSPLVGRDAELERLRAAWARARGGRGAVVVVSGPPGIGCTRLAAELAPRCSERVRACSTARRAPGARPRDRRCSCSTTSTARPLSWAEPTLGVLCVVTTADSGLAGGWVPSTIALPRRSMPTGVAAIARQYAPAGAEMPVADLAARSGGVPERAHRLAVDWARAEAARRLAAAADDTGADRNGLRRSEQRLASTVVELRALRERAERRDAEPATTVCPYKGLAPYDRADAAFFFGRERLVAEMVARLVGARLLGIVGPSGSGKSSALRAGLLPELAGGVLPGTENWAAGPAAPGRAPAAEPRGRDRHGEAAPAPADRRRPVRRGLHALRRRGRARGVRRRRSSARSGGSGSVVVLALRADFYGRCAAYPELATLLGANHVLVGPMQRDELRRAIELPAQRAGLRVERELVERLLADAEDEPGALPLLSSALLELWQQRDGRHLRLAAYERTGGVRGAVARLAEAAYERLDPAQQILARNRSCCASPARTRAAAPCAGASRSTNSTPTATTSAQCSTRSPAAGSSSSTRGPRRWPTRRCCASGRGCAAWLEEDADGRRLHRHLAVAAREWEAGGRDPGDLYRGARLASTLDWSAGHGAELNELERAFVEASVAHGEREARRARRANRRLRALLGRRRRPARARRRRRRAVPRPARPGAQRGDDRGGRAARRAGARRARPRPLAAARAPGRGDRRLAADAQQPARRADAQPGRDRRHAHSRTAGCSGSRCARTAARSSPATTAATSDFLDPGRRRRSGPRTARPRSRSSRLAFSPDGSRLAVGGQGTVASARRPHVGGASRHRTVPDVEFAALAFSPDGRDPRRDRHVDGSTAPIRPVPSALLRFDARTGRRSATRSGSRHAGALADAARVQP